MKVPNKFWFYHYSDEDIVYFAEGDEHKYVISGGDLEHPNYRTTDEVESYLQKGYWVLTVPDKFKVRGVLTDSIYSFIKDANNLYVMTGENITSPIFHYEKEVLDSLYGEKRVWEIHTEERADVVKEKPPVKKSSDKKLISINVNSVRAAAEFDVANNKHTVKKNLSLEVIEKEIVEHIREMYSTLISGEREWEMCYVCSRSYSVRFRPEDENYGVISVEVDPSIGKPIFYAPVEDFLNQN